MWIPFELGQTVYVIVDNGYDTSKTVHDGYDHIGELTHTEKVHHPIYNIESRKFDLKMLAYYKLDEIYTTIGEAEDNILLSVKRI